jgi:hypothetical protein
MLKSGTLSWTFSVYSNFLELAPDPVCAKFAVFPAFFLQINTFALKMP